MRRVFLDTGVLLAMVVFPRSRSGGLTLAGEVLELHQAGVFEAVVGQAVVDELDEVLEERFPAHRLQAVRWLMPYADRLIRRPTPAEIVAALPVCTDPSDAPIFASAVIAKPDVVLSNDFRAFHPRQAKEFWQRHCMSVLSLYGFLCLLGRRERGSAQ